MRRDCGPRGPATGRTGIGLEVILVTHGVLRSCPVAFHCQLETTKRHLEEVSMIEGLPGPVKPGAVCGEVLT